MPAGTSADLPYGQRLGPTAGQVLTVPTYQPFRICRSLTPRCRATPQHGIGGVGSARTNIRDLCGISYGSVLRPQRNR